MKAETPPRPTLDLVAREIASKALPYDGRQPIDRLIPLPELLTLIPVCRVSVWNMVRKGMMPAPLKLGGSNRIAWRSSEIAAWIAKQPRTTPKRAA